VRSRGESYLRQTVGGRCGVEHDISDGLSGRLLATRPRALTASTGGNIPLTVLPPRLVRDCDVADFGSTFSGFRAYIYRI